MNYYSLNKKAPAVSFREATINGQAPDKGLYFPERIPAIEPEFFKNIRNKTDQEIAFRVMEPYTRDALSEQELNLIIAETIDFPIPLVQVTPAIYSLELYHGPTLAFKDIGARFMSRCLGLFSRARGEKVTVLVATSGDTGGAVANGFYEVEGVEVVILYPSGKVSAVQEKQLTTLGKNIHALEVAGSFDDCQRMVKQAFADTGLNARLFLTSANSINVARWLPQQFYYFFAYKQWQHQEPPVFSVPSGNFGNICAGMLAQISGLPVGHFIAACNANDAIPEFLQTSSFTPKKAVATISNAMDVGNPSNFARILELFDHEFLNLKNALDSYSISDPETREVIKRVYTSLNYLLDPHGAVGFAALEKYISFREGVKGIVLETAHPVKFFDVVEPITGEKIELPKPVSEIMDRPKASIRITADYQNLKDFLLGN